jgi:hypothetical protein
MLTPFDDLGPGRGKSGPYFDGSLSIDQADRSLRGPAHIGPWHPCPGERGSSSACRYCGLIEIDTELSVIFNRANRIDKDPKYADIFSGLQQKKLAKPKLFFPLFFKIED